MKAHAVHIAAYPNAEAEKVAANLRRVYAVSSGQHRLVESPEQASIILVGGIGNEMPQNEYIQQTVRHPLISQYPEKCFTVSYRDTPVVFNRGVYESALASRWTDGRCVTGSYELSGHNNAEVSPAPSTTKDLLFSFVGRSSYPGRAQMLRLSFTRPDVYLEDTSAFGYWSAAPEERAARERSFASVLSRSKFCLCPRGAGVGSIRLFEAMRSGIAPVIIADGWIPPAGIDWSSFAITLRESEIDTLEQRVAEREPDYARMGQAARNVWEQHFAESTYFDYLVRGCSGIQSAQRVPERVYWSLRHVIAAETSARRLAGRLGHRAKRVLGRG